jgi:hypothetical protein
MSFAPIKVGGWAFEDPIDEDQISLVQEYLLKCANFVDGGIYAPSSPIVVGGAGITGTIGGFVDLRANNSQLVESLKTDANNGDYLYSQTCRRVVADLPSGTNILFLANTANSGGGAPAPTLGSIIEITNPSVTNPVKVRIQGAGSDFLVIPQSGSSLNWAEFMWRNSTWNIHRYNIV